MASTTAQIRAALATAVSNGVTGWQVSAYMLAAPQPPTIDIVPNGTTYDLAMARGLDDLSFLIRAMVAYNADQGAQIKLDTLVDTTGSGCMKAVVEADKTLGGVVQDLRVTDASPYKAYLIEGQPPLLGVEFTVELYP